jgi:hypothetical protein
LNPLGSISSPLLNSALNCGSLRVLGKTNLRGCFMFHLLQWGRKCGIILILSSLVVVAQQGSLPGVMNGSLAWGDYDGDGNLDLLITGTSGSRGIARIFHNEAGDFRTYTTLSTNGLIRGKSFWGDFDRNGTLDVLVTVATPNSAPHTLVLLNRGGEFIDSGISLPGAAQGWEDCNGDGLLDVITSSDTEAVSRIYFQSSPGKFDRAPQILTPAAYSADWGDFDNDGTPELLVHFEASTRLYRLVGGERFEDTQLPFPQGMTALDWGDVNNDGYLDILMAARTLQGNLTPKILLNKGGVSFTDMNPDHVLIPDTPVAFGDYDGDGLLDVVIVGVGVDVPGQHVYPHSRLFRNVGSGALEEQMIVWPGVVGGAVAIGGQNRNGSSTLAISGATFSSSEPPYVWLPKGPTTTTTTPAAPADLQAKVAGDRVVLSWSKGLESDSTGGLTYNLRVGTKPGYGDIVVPLLNQDDTRQVAHSGNCRTALQRRLQKLPLGKYFWSVQALNHRFVPSSFAREEEFVITNAPPLPPLRISKIADQTIRDGTPLKPFTIEVSDPDARLWITSTSEWLVPVDRAVIVGSGTNRTLSLASADNLSGEATVFIHAETPFGAHATSFFHLIVQQVDDPPVIGEIENVSLIAGQEPLVIALNVSDDLTSPTDLKLTAHAADPDLVSVSVDPDWRLGGHWGLTVRSLTQRTGSTVITVQISDGRNLTQTSFIVTVRLPPMQPTNLLPEVAGYSSAIAWGDYNSDGKMDIFVAAQPGGDRPAGFAHLLKNSGGDLAEDALFSIKNPPIIAAWGDSDNDGDLDLYVCGSDGAFLYRNDGNQGFTPTRLIYPITSGSVKWVDVDNDGDLDLIVAGSASNGTSFLRLLRNDGGNHFTGVALPRLAGTPVVIDIGDFDQDGDNDILVIMTNPVPFLRLLRNEGDGIFMEINPFAANHLKGGLTSTDLNPNGGWCDFDNDGFLDIWTGGTFFEPANLHLYRNNRHGGFENPVVLSKITGPLAWGDFDNDGRLDIVTAPFSWSDWGGGQRPGLLEIFHNESDTRFTSLGRFRASQFPLAASPADFDRNGMLDLALANWISPPEILSNYTGTVNTLPGPPAGLLATTNGMAVTFTWKNAWDENQPTGLTYNLRVGTRPGGNEILSAMSLPDGTRLLPQAGNMGARLSWTLTNLTAEAYFWSVQAVDHSFAGSMFAPEQVAILHPSTLPPTISAVPGQTVIEDTHLDIPFMVTGEKTRPDLLNVRAESSNEILLPDRNLSLTSSNGVRVLSLLPATNQFGKAAIRLTVTDFSGLSSSDSFAVTVLPANDRPFAQDSAISTQEDHSVVITLQASDVDKDALSYEIISQPFHGTVHLTRDSEAVYTPITNYFGLDEFIFRVSDGLTNSRPAHVSIYVGPVTDLQEARLAVLTTPDGALQFTYGGEPWQRVRLEFSEDMRRWELETIMQPADGRFQFIEKAFQDRPRRFYRILPSD